MVTEGVHRQLKMTMNNSGVGACRLIDVPRNGDERGELAVVEGGQSIPFEIKRVFYMYGVPEGCVRAGHANIRLQQLMIAMAGQFEVVLDDGQSRQSYRLAQCWQGLYIPGMIWRELKGFSAGAVCAVLCSEHYDASDYYREYRAFREAIRAGVH